MSSLFSTLQIGQQALQAQQFGLQITQKNIANVNTPGYTQEQPEFIPGDPTGVSATEVQSFRNRFLDYSISQESQGQGEQQSVATVLQQIEAYLNENSGQGLQDTLSNFFNSFSDLANTPEDMTLRQQVISQAGMLAGKFNQLYGQVQGVQASVDQQVSDTLQEINTITSKIADLNSDIAQYGVSHSPDEATARDQRQQLINQLSGMVDLTYFETETGALTVTTKQGSLLVVGNQSHQLQAVVSSGSSFLQIESDGQNITSQIQSGKLGGLLTARDALIPGYLKTLDDLAAGIIDRVNTVHKMGSDINGAQGGDFFVPFTPAVSGSNVGAARTMAVAITDPAQVAAAGPTSGPGSNANALLLAGIQNEKLFSSGTATGDQFYASLIFSLGTDLQTAQDSQNTQNQILTQLQNQQDAVSGVNLDDEAVNIIRYQKAYQASARMVNVVDTLTDDLLLLFGS